MVDWNTPATSDSYSNHQSYLKSRDVSSATMDFSSDSNVPTGAVRVNNTTKRLEYYDGADWQPLFDGAIWSIDVDTVDGSHASAFAAAAHVGAGGAAHAAATTSVNGFLSAADKTKIDGLGNLSTENSPLAVSKGGTAGTTASAARTNLGLGTAAEKNTGVSNGQVPVMDATGYPAADGSQLTSLPSAAGFGAAAQLGVATGGSGSLLRSDGVGSSLTAIKGRLIAKQVILSSTTVNLNANTTAILVILQGGGGGGGAGASSSGGGGGGSGAYKEAFIVSPSASYSVTIGLGGAGGVGATGSNGGSSSFGSGVVSCNGGSGGVYGPTSGDGGAGGGVGALESEDVRLAGRGGEDRQSSAGGAGGMPAGIGYGGVRKRTATATIGAYGGGGGGGDAGESGGAGGAGYCIVYEFGSVNHA